MRRLSARIVTMHASRRRSARMTTGDKGTDSSSLARAMHAEAEASGGMDSSSPLADASSAGGTDSSSLAAAPAGRYLFSSSTPRAPATHCGTYSAAAKPAKAPGRVTKVEFASHADCTAGQRAPAIYLVSGGTSWNDRLTFFGWDARHLELISPGVAILSQPHRVVINV